jgi:hypothetical protein
MQEEARLQTRCKTRHGYFNKVDDFFELLLLHADCLTRFTLIPLQVYHDEWKRTRKENNATYLPKRGLSESDSALHMWRVRSKFVALFHHHQPLIIFPSGCKQDYPQWN